MAVAEKHSEPNGNRVFNIQSDGDRVAGLDGLAGKPGVPAGKTKLISTWTPGSGGNGTWDGLQYR